MRNKISFIGIIALLSVLLLNSTALMAQEASISGIVKNIEGNPISFASVFVDGTYIGVATNDDGYYQLKNLKPGTYVIKASVIGFMDGSKSIELKQGEAKTEINFSLENDVTILDEVTVMLGDKTTERRTPGSGTFVSPREIEKFNYTDVNRTLGAIPGVNIQEEDGFGLRPNIGMRGTGVERSAKITLMEDGILMAPAPYAAPSAYYFPTIGRMSAIEVLKGASQIKYGPYTTGGALNLISTPIPQELKTKVNISRGTFATTVLSASIGDKKGQFSYLLEGFNFSSNGFKEIEIGKAGFRKSDFIAKAKYESKPGANMPQSIAVKAGKTTELSHETYLGLTENDFEQNPNMRYLGSQLDNITTEQNQYSVRHQIKFSKNLSLNTTAYYTDFQRNWYKLDKVAESAGNSVSISNILLDPENYDTAFAILSGEINDTTGALSVKANNRTYYSKGLQSVLRYNRTTEKMDHHLELGIRIHEDQIDRFQWVDTYDMVDKYMIPNTRGAHGTESNRVETANALAAYAQYKLDINKFSIHPGVRYENITKARQDYGKVDTNRTGINLVERENEIQVIIPGMGVDYQINAFNTAFVGVHKGFAPAGSNAGSLPEESINYELGYRRYYSNYSLTAVVFMNQYSNLQGSDLAANGGTGNGDMFNAGKAETKGLELTVSYDLEAFADKGIKMPLSVSYTFTDAHFLTGFDSEFEGWGAVAENDALPYLSRHQVSGNIGFNLKKIEVNLAARHNSEMRTSPGSGEIVSAELIPSFTVLDLAANYRFSDKFTARLGITNITDATYLVARRPAGLRPGMPRALNLGLKASF